jgi:hypothetical protein
MDRNGGKPCRLLGFSQASIFIFSQPFHLKVIQRASQTVELNVRQVLPTQCTGHGGRSFGLAFRLAAMPDLFSFIGAPNVYHQYKYQFSHGAAEPWHECKLTVQRHAALIVRFAH